MRGSRSKMGSVFIGVGKIWLEIPDCKSLKEKRSVLKPLLGRIREKFQVSVSEIGHQDSHRHAVVGVSILGNRSQHVERCLGAIIESLLHGRHARVVDYKTEILSAGGVGLAPELNPVDDETLRSVEENWIESDEGGEAG
jgi:uncharacterized protein YlxP (DUF503 family)